MKFKCYMCEGSNGKIRASASQMRFGCYGYDKNVIECNDCGLVQLYPLWTESELMKLYSEYSQKKDFKGHKVKIKLDCYLAKHIDKQDKVLEIGCGQGHNVKWLRKKGYDVVGIDRDSTVEQEEIVSTCKFEDFDSSSNKFDFIYAIHVLEHIEDPLSFLNKIVDTLRNGGEFLLETPNIDDPLISLYKNKAYHMFAWYPYHVYFFGLDSIRKLINKCPNIDSKIILKQRYGVLNHLRWLIVGKPGNCNFHIPVLDDIYKFVLTKMFKVSDTIVVISKKVM